MILFVFCRSSSEVNGRDMKKLKSFVFAIQMYNLEKKSICKLIVITRGKYWR